MAPRFEIAAGSHVGAAHAAAGRNNQDAFAWAHAEADLVAVVCDGCSGAARSEIGAGLVARLVVREASRRLGRGLDAEILLEEVRVAVLDQLRRVATAISVETTTDARPGAVTGFRKTVADCFLCTVVGVLIDGPCATTFALGDGVLVVNGDRRHLGPFEDNAPPYLAYELLDAARAYRFAVHPSFPASDVRSILLGTDGAHDLESTADALAPFWEDARVFRNADMIRRRLAIVSRGPNARRLADDTTILVVRPRTEAA